MKRITKEELANRADNIFYKIDSKKFINETEYQSLESKTSSIWSNTNKWTKEEIENHIAKLLEVESRKA